MPAHTPLEQQLILAPWFAYQLGYSSILQMLSELADTSEGWSGARSNVLTHIMQDKQGGNISIPFELLDAMDKSIADDLAHINRGRIEPISLKYFQYLAALATEYFLYRLEKSPSNLVKDLNSFRVSMTRSYELAHNLPKYDADEPGHLAKLALWMATGSGKTLLMHLNILQFLRRKIFVPDNILLITPNAELTAQHMAELKISSIDCHRHNEARDIFTQRKSICVIEIHKLQPSDAKPTKQGVSMPVDRFAGRNLILVDEGHKGAAGKHYFEIRDQLVANKGFAFEYSATFKQAITAAPTTNRRARTTEYVRAIVFDYSYQHFHADGYGKDYFIVNASKEADKKTDILMLGNLLAFFQQQFAYNKYGEECALFQIAQPLLLMLGTTVTGGKDSSEEVDSQTDIIKIISFLQRVVSDKNSKGQPWLEKLVEKIITGKSGIAYLNNDARDIFEDKFDFLRETFSPGDTLNIADLCRHLRQMVFHTPTAADLQFRPLKKTMHGSASNEIALRAGDGVPPFALVYVGNAAKLRMLAEQNGIRVEEDSLQSPLFSHVNNHDSPVNILIGAKKFMEGWNSWRVSSMGLLNVGQGEGPLIVQLFGRGIRLQGRGWSLKRSTALPDRQQPDEQIHPILKLLETLNIFSIRAKYMEEFCKGLEDDGRARELIKIPIRVLPVDDGQRGAPGIDAEELRRKNLLVPKNLPDTSPKVFELKQEDGVSATVDLSSVTVATNKKGVLDATTHQTRTHDFDTKKIDLDDLYLHMLARKNANNESNVFVCFKNMEGVLKSCSYRLDADADPLRGMRLQKVAKEAACLYADKLQARHHRQWQSANMRFVPLESGGKNRHPNFADYELRLPSKLVGNIQGIVESPVLLYTGGSPDDRHLPRLYFDRHLYQPLLVDDSSNKIRISPSPLNEGEIQLVETLSKYVAERKPTHNNELFLLRNHSKRGVTFCLENGDLFYPDFMLWIVGKNSQRLVFLEPHGMRMAKRYNADGKARFWEYLRDFPKSKLPKNPSLEMDSFILSVTPYRDLKDNYASGTKHPWSKQEFAEHHILFMEDLEFEDKRAELFEQIGIHLS